MIPVRLAVPGADAIANAQGPGGKHNSETSRLASQLNDLSVVR